MVQATRLHNLICNLGDTCGLFRCTWECVCLCVCVLYIYIYMSVGPWNRGGCRASPPRLGIFLRLWSFFASRSILGVQPYVVI
jgi:hypothetical protein